MRMRAQDPVKLCHNLLFMRSEGGEVRFDWWEMDCPKPTKQKLFVIAHTFSILTPSTLLDFFIYCPCSNFFIFLFTCHRFQLIGSTFFLSFFILIDISDVRKINSLSHTFFFSKCFAKTKKVKIMNTFSFNFSPKIKILFKNQVSNNIKKLVKVTRKQERKNLKRKKRTEN